MIWTIVGIILAIWLFSVIFHLVGGAIPILLVGAAAILIYKFFKGQL